MTSTKLRTTIPLKYRQRQVDCIQSELRFIEKEKLSYWNWTAIYREEKLSCWNWTAIYRKEKLSYWNWTAIYREEKLSWNHIISDKVEYFLNQNSCRFLNKFYLIRNRNVIKEKILGVQNICVIVVVWNTLGDALLSHNFSDRYENLSYHAKRDDNSRRCWAGNL